MIEGGGNPSTMNIAASKIEGKALVVAHNGVEIYLFMNEIFRLISGLFSNHLKS
jgi:hypothetical protein